jgi:hypothetical protein
MGPGRSPKQAPLDQYRWSLFQRGDSRMISTGTQLIYEIGRQVIAIAQSSFKFHPIRHAEQVVERLVSDE